MVAQRAPRKIMNGDSVSFVIPIYNEVANLPALIHRCIDVGESLARRFEIVLIDDGSEDGSVALIRRAVEHHPGRVVGLFLNRNYGQHAAVMAGLDASSGDVIVTLDADLQNPPEEIPKLLEKIDSGCDVVGSVRQVRRDSLFRRFGSFIINRAVQRATGVSMRDYGCMLRAYRRPVVDAMLQCGERSTFIPVLANSFASHPVEIEVRHAERENDSSKYTLWKLIKLQFDLLTSATTFPLRMLSLVGSALALLGFLFGLFLLLARGIYGAEWAAQGVFTLFAAMFFLVGAQLLGLGLLGEYIGRIYDDVRARPRYLIRERVGAVDWSHDQANSPRVSVALRG